MPPRRDRTTPRPDDPPLLRALDEAVETAETAAGTAKIEDIDVTHARLQAQLAERRKLREI
jgi:membrane protein YdbS with pleckstrin-like domain